MYFQEWWQEAYDLKKETDIIAGSLGFGSNLKVEDEAAYDGSVQNFSYGSQEKTAAFSNLIEIKSTFENNANFGMVQMKVLNNNLSLK